MDDKNRQKAIDLAFANIEKEYGKGSIMRLKDGESTFNDVEAIPTGSIGLDIALGIGGYPKGRIIEIYGPESSGKTTLALHVIANAQKNRGVAAIIDAEHALDPTYARKLGVNLDNLLISQPDYGEQALEIAETLVTSGAVDVIVIDSVAALVPKAELEGEMGDSHVGLHARLMSQALRKLTSLVARANCTVIFINQIREKIGVMFGSPETTTGGRALKFYSSIRVDIRKTTTLKNGEEAFGTRVKAKVVKNKCAPPFKVAEFDVLFDKGISWTGDVVDLACEHQIINKSGSWFSFGDQRLGQGRENTIQYLQENPPVLMEVESQLLAKLFPAPAETQAAAAPVAAPANGTNGTGKKEKKG
ncbi:MAG TPA: recombinase RecA [Planctomycetota bacterium]|nr:recombinase RecA [Planctomycetota bacterium]